MSAAFSSFPSRFSFTNTGKRSAPGSKAPASHCITFVLHAEREELRRRIATDPANPNSPWRLEHLDDYDATRSWHSQEAHVIDTTNLKPRAIAPQIAEAAGISGR
ncbi:hypothetical protein [Nocardia sp. NPDC051981]|uniref:hypothetical protein n=1 Tax=Nocardia sp. NPDC051981 TaxID=3155417 RepID=UPI0034179EC9